MENELVKIADAAESIEKVLPLGKRLAKGIKAYFSVKNLKKLLKFSMTLICGAWLLGLWNVTSGINISIETFQGQVIIKLIGLFILIQTVFYFIVDYLFRLLFHGYFKGKILAARKELTGESELESSKIAIQLANSIAPGIYKYFLRLGVAESGEFRTELKVTLEQREQIYNIAMAELYFWLVLVLQSGLTIGFAWQYYPPWFIILLSIAFVLILAALFVTTFFLMNIDLMEVIRIKILKEQAKAEK